MSFRDGRMNGEASPWTGTTTAFWRTLHSFCRSEATNLQQTFKISSFQTFTD